jgi:hypothetical protein
MFLALFFSLRQGVQPFLIFLFFLFLGVCEPSDSVASRGVFRAESTANLGRNFSKLRVESTAKLGPNLTLPFGANGKNDPSGCG